MSPLAWVVGAIGPELGLSLVQSIVIMVVGQAAGALIFGGFTLMGKRTGVSQLALSRMAFGRRGNNIPSIVNGVIVLGWLGLNTYVVLGLATYCLHKLGLPNNHATEYSVAAVIMIIQLVIGTLGFYAIRTFEKWTVPALGAVMAVMTVLAFSKGQHRVEPLDRPRVRADHRRERADDRGGNRLGVRLVGVGVGLLAVHPARGHREESVLGVRGRHVRALFWLGVLGAAMASSATNSDPAELVASLFGVMTIPVLLVIMHGAVAGNIECVYSAPLCFLAGGIKVKRWVGSIISGVIASARAGRVLGVQQLCHHVHQLHGLVRDLDGRMGRDRGHRFLRSQPGTRRSARALRFSWDIVLRRHSLALARGAADRAGCRVGIRVRQGVAVPGSDLARRQRSGLLVAGFNRVWGIGVLVAVPLGAAPCRCVFACRRPGEVGPRARLAKRNSPVALGPAACL